MSLSALAVSCSQFLRIARGLLGEGYTSGLAAFARYPNMCTRSQGHVLPVDSCHFRQAHAGLHRRQEQRVIPTTTPRPRIRRGQ